MGADVVLVISSRRTGKYTYSIDEHAFLQDVLLAESLGRVAPSLTLTLTCFCCKYGQSLDSLKPRAEPEMNSTWLLYYIHQ